MEMAFWRENGFERTYTRLIKFPEWDVKRRQKKAFKSEIRARGSEEADPAQGSCLNIISRFDENVNFVIQSKRMHDFAQDWANLFNAGALLSLLTLTVLEIVLGIDNIIFISIVAGKLPRTLQPRARALGLSLALLFRIGLLLCITWILRLQQPLFTLWGFGATGRDLILFGGGVFLIFKTVKEIAGRLQGEEEEAKLRLQTITMQSVVLQIVFIDIVFSFDSILTAVSLVSNVLIMIGAVILAMFLMLAFSGKVSDFINRHPALKMLALAFLLMVGLLLIFDALHFRNMEELKRYVYCSMVFAFGVELLNMRERRNKRNKK